MFMMCSTYHLHAFVRCSCWGTRVPVTISTFFLLETACMKEAQIYSLTLNLVPRILYHALFHKARRSATAGSSNNNLHILLMT